MVQGRQEGAADRRGPTPQYSGRLLRSRRIHSQAVSSESLLILEARPSKDKPVVLHVRLAKPDCLEAGDQPDVGLLLGQGVRAGSCTRSSQGRLGRAVLKQDLGALGRCLRSAATDLLA